MSRPGPLRCFLGAALILLAWAASAPAAQQADCLSCHEKDTPGAVAQWRQSVHEDAGVGCADCHGGDHDRIEAGEAYVSVEVCGRCHQEALATHKESRHGMGLHSGWGCTRNLTGRDARECSFCHDKSSTIPLSTVQCGRFLKQTSEMGAAGCNRCHQVERSCAACHSNHDTDLAIVRSPAVCATCHMGPDHPQWEVWKTSKHGTLYDSKGLGPSCQDCHFEGSGHNVSAGIAYPSSGFRYDEAQTQKKRDFMLDLCVKCHGRNFSRRELDNTDAIREQSTAMVEQAAEIIRELHDEGLLDPMPDERPPHPLRGNELVLDQQILFEDVSHIERLYFKMKKFDLAKTLVGGYHQNPDYTHWYGNAELKMDLVDIRAEASRLRRLAALEKGRGTARTPDKAAVLEEELRRLKSRFQRGAMSEQEYGQRKKELLDASGASPD